MFLKLLTSGYKGLQGYRAENVNCVTVLRRTGQWFRVCWSPAALSVAKARELSLEGRGDCSLPTCRERLSAREAAPGTRGPSFPNPWCSACQTQNVRCASGIAG